MIKLVCYPFDQPTPPFEIWEAWNNACSADGATAAESSQCLLNRFAALLPYQPIAFDLDVMEDIDVSLTLTIQDIQDITKRQGSFSKTITLPSTPNNDACFNYAYNVQSFVGGFTPNKRVKCALWDTGIQVFNGTLQLLYIRKTGGFVEYEVGIYSEEVAFFREINEKLLCNTAGVSAFNHTIDWTTTVQNSWTTALGSGYVYGLVDGQGLNDVVPIPLFSNTLLVPTFAFTPSFFVKQLVDLIFAEAGYEYESAFFNSTRFKRLVIPYAAGGHLMTDLSVENSFVESGGSQPSWVEIEPGVYNRKILFNDRITDPGGKWLSGEFYASSTSVTTWQTLTKLTITNDNPSTTDNFFSVFWRNQADDSVLARWDVEVPSGQSRVFDLTTTFTLPPGAACYFDIFTRVDPGFLSVVTAEASFICLQNDDFVSTVDMTTALPMDITQADLLSDLQKMFNLYFYIRPEEPKKIYIEPFNDWYASGVVDFTQKVDEGAEQLLLTGDPEARQSITFKYRNPGDALSKTYDDVFADGYGSRIYKTDNYYAKGEQTIETKCATVIPATYRSGLPIGRVFDTNANGTIKQRPTGYRIAQYNYIESPNWLLLIDFLTPVITLETKLPFISHIDDPFAPTFDLSFGMPKQLYYSVINQDQFVDYTNANLFNTYWKTYIEETTSKEALTIELTAVLDAADIYNLDFRVPIYYKGIKWRLLKIEGYQVGGSKPCRITLRRILNLAQPSMGAVNVKQFFDVGDLVLGEMKPQISTPTIIG